MMTKKIIIIIFASLVLTLSLAINSHAIPTVSLTVSDSYIKTGEMFNIEVWVDGDGICEDLVAFGFDVITAGSFFSYNGYYIESGFLNVSDPSNQNNVSGYGGSSNDDILLATLSFTGLAAGTDSLQILGGYDGFFYGLFYESGGYDIASIENITIHPWSVPEPATLALLGVGLVGLTGISRRKYMKKS